MTDNKNGAESLIKNKRREEFFEKFKKNSINEKENLSTSKVESDELAALFKKYSHTYRPAVVASKPVEFAFCGSAQQYYNDAILKILNTFPFDGSRKDLIEWHLGCSTVELAIYKQLWPGTLNHFKSNNSEMISFYSGPNKIPESEFSGKLRGVEPGLLINPEKGNTIEFWMRKDSFDHVNNPLETIFDIGTFPGKLASNESAQIKLELACDFLSGGVDQTPFRFTYKIAGVGVTSLSIGSENLNTTHVADSEYHHYSIKVHNTDGTLTIKLYIDGVLNSTHTSVTGAQAVANRFLGGAIAGNHGATTGNFSGYLDHFRFWKGQRSGREIARFYDQKLYASENETTNYTSQLGLYFRFNEGVVNNSDQDRLLLDYSGYENVGTIINFTNACRVPGSAISESSVTSNSEAPEPIMQQTNSSVLLLRQTLANIGKSHDANNPNMLQNFIPQWARDEIENSSSPTEFQILLHLMSSELDEIKIHIDSLAKDNIPNWQETNQIVEKRDNANSSAKVINYDSNIFLGCKDKEIDTISANGYRGDRYVRAAHNAGLVVQKFFQKAYKLEDDIEGINQEQNLEAVIEEINHGFEQRLAEEAPSLMKEKGTISSISRIYNISGLDNNILTDMHLVPNSDILIDDEKNERNIKKTKIVNFSDNTEAVLYMSSSAADQRSYIVNNSGSLTSEYTLEGNFIFPSQEVTTFDEKITSIFGIREVSSTNNDLTVSNPDRANLSIQVEKKNLESEKARFIVKSDSSVMSDNLTTQYFNKVYDNSRWNLSIRVRKSTSEPFIATSQDTHELVFSGYRYVLDDLIDSFELTSSISPEKYNLFNEADKTIYCGAARQNITGSTQKSTDNRVLNFSFWNDSLKNEELQSRAQNPFITSRPSSHMGRNKGFEGSSHDSCIFRSQFSAQPTRNSADAFVVQDEFGGNLQLSLSGDAPENYQYNFSSLGFTKNFEKIILEEQVSHIRPTPLLSNKGLEQVSIKEEKYKNYEPITKANVNIFSFEKSIYQAVARDMYNFISGVKSFNNLLGEPINKYRQNYKLLTHLREKYFSNVLNEIDFERYMKYYKWIDSAIGFLLGQMIPAAAFSNIGIEDVVESHAFERGKYQHKYNRMEQKPPKLEASLLAINEMLYDWEHGHAPLSGNEDDNCLWQKDRKELSPERTRIQEVLTTKVTGSYRVFDYVQRNLIRPYKLSSDNQMQLNIGHNRKANKIDDLYKIIYTGKEIHINKEDLYEFRKCNDIINPNEEKIYVAKTNTTDTDGYLDADADLILPFTFYSSSAGVDFEEFKDKLKITNNLERADSISSNHPFVNIGLPHRNVKLGTPFSDRPEAYFISSSSDSLVIKQPQGQRSVYFNGVQRTNLYNTTNIKTKLDPYIQGNYSKDYEIVMTNGRTLNNNYLVENEGAGLTGSVNESTLISGSSDFAVPNRTRREHVIVNKFSAPGGPETSAPFALDRAAAEYSIYNTVNYRNLVVRSSYNAASRLHSGLYGFAHPHSYSIPAGYPVNPATFVVARDGADAPLPRIMGSFRPVRYSKPNSLGYHSITDFGNTFQRPEYYEIFNSGSMHKTNRNYGLGDLSEYNSPFTTVTYFPSALKADNFFVQHEIPRTDLSYSWIRNSLGNTLQGFLPPSGEETRSEFLRWPFQWRNAGAGHQHNFNVSQTINVIQSGSGFDIGANGFSPAKTSAESILFESASFLGFATNPSVGMSGPIKRSVTINYPTWPFIPVDFAGLNTIIYEPVNTSENHMGFSLTNFFGNPNEPTRLDSVIINRGRPEVNYHYYYNNDFIYALLGHPTTIADRSGPAAWSASGLNMLIANRQGPYGWPSWKQTRTGQHPIARSHKKNNIISAVFRDGYPFVSCLPGAQHVNSTTVENTQTITKQREIKNYKEIMATCKFNAISAHMHTLRTISGIEFSSAGVQAEGIPIDNTIHQAAFMGMWFNDEYLHEYVSNPENTHTGTPYENAGSLPSISIRVPIQNTVTGFANQDMADDFRFVEKSFLETQNLQKINTFIEQNSRRSAATFMEVNYIETVYPREINTFTKEARTRERFKFFGWNSSRANRNLILSGNISYGPGLTYAPGITGWSNGIRASFEQAIKNEESFETSYFNSYEMVDDHYGNYAYRPNPNKLIKTSTWVLDSREDFSKRPTSISASYYNSLNDKFYGLNDYASTGPERDQGTRGEGLLQNDYSIFQLGANQLRGAAPFAPVYNRRFPQFDSSSAIGIGSPAEAFMNFRSMPTITKTNHPDVVQLDNHSIRFHEGPTENSNIKYEYLFDSTGDSGKQTGDIAPGGEIYVSTFGVISIEKLTERLREAITGSSGHGSTMTLTTIAERLLAAGNDSGAIHDGHKKVFIFTMAETGSAPNGNLVSLSGSLVHAHGTHVDGQPLPQNFINMMRPAAGMAYGAFGGGIDADSPDALRVGGDELLSGEAKFEVAEKSSSFGAFYDDYTDFNEEIKLAGQEYSLLSEFRISRFIEDIYNTGNFEDPSISDDFLELTGAIYHTSSGELSIGKQFFKTYSNSDFMKYFEPFRDNVTRNGFDINSGKLTLRCQAIKRLLPYRGFYPAERAAQITEIFHKNYLREDTYDTTYIDQHPIPEEDAKKLLKIKINNTKSQVCKPLFAPGVLFNSIKTGIAVDYPLFSSSIDGPREALIRNKITFPVMDWESFSLDSTTCYTGSLINSTVDQGIPRIKGGVERRVIFEDLLEPERLFGQTIHENEPHPSASIYYGEGVWAYALKEDSPQFGTLNLDHTETHNGLYFNQDQSSTFDSLKSYRSAINNYCSETVKFFLEDQKLQSMVPEPSKPTLQANVQYKMRVYLQNRNTSMYDRHSAFGPPTDDGSPSILCYEDVNDEKPGQQASGSVGIPKTSTESETLDLDGRELAITSLHDGELKTSAYRFVRNVAGSRAIANIGLNSLNDSDFTTDKTLGIDALKNGNSQRITFIFKQGVEGTGASSSLDFSASFIASVPLGQIPTDLYGYPGQFQLFSSIRNWFFDLTKASMGNLMLKDLYSPRLTPYDFGDTSLASFGNNKDFNSSCQFVSALGEQNGIKLKYFTGELFQRESGSVIRMSFSDHTSRNSYVEDALQITGNLMEDYAGVSQPPEIISDNQSISSFAGYLGFHLGVPMYLATDFSSSAENSYGSVHGQIRSHQKSNSPLFAIPIGFYDSYTSDRTIAAAAESFSNLISGSDAVGMAIRSPDHVGVNNAGTQVDLVLGTHYYVPFIDVRTTRNGSTFKTGAQIAESVEKLINSGSFAYLASIDQYDPTSNDPVVQTAAGMVPWNHSGIESDNGGSSYYPRLRATSPASNFITPHRHSQAGKENELSLFFNGAVVALNSASPSFTEGTRVKDWDTNGATTFMLRGVDATNAGFTQGGFGAFWKNYAFGDFSTGAHFPKYRPAGILFQRMDFTVGGDTDENPFAHVSLGYGHSFTHEYQGQTITTNYGNGFGAQRYLIGYDARRAGVTDPALRMSTIQDVTSSILLETGGKEGEYYIDFIDLTDAPTTYTNGNPCPPAGGSIWYTRHFLSTGNQGMNVFTGNTLASYSAQKWNALNSANPEVKLTASCGGPLDGTQGSTQPQGYPFQNKHKFTVETEFTGSISSVSRPSSDDLSHSTLIEMTIVDNGSLRTFAGGTDEVLITSGDPGPDPNSFLVAANNPTNDPSWTSIGHQLSTAVLASNQFHDSADDGGYTVTVVQFDTGSEGNNQLIDTASLDTAANFAGLVQPFDFGTDPVSYTNGQLIETSQNNNGTPIYAVSIVTSSADTGSIDGGTIATNLKSAIDQAQTWETTSLTGFVFSQPRTVNMVQSDSGSAGNVSISPKAQDSSLHFDEWSGYSSALVQGFAGGIDFEPRTTILLQGDPRVKSGSHGFLPYVAPFLDPNTNPYAEMIFTPEQTKEYTIPEIIEGLSITYNNMPDISVPVSSRDSTNFKEAMSLSASLNLANSVLLYTDNYIHRGSPGKTTVIENNNPDFYRWVIQPKWETPVFDFENVETSALNLSTGQVEKVTGSPWKTRYQKTYYECETRQATNYLTASTGVWHQHGKPTVTNNKKGYYLSLVGAMETTGKQTVRNLAQAVGFLDSSFEPQTHMQFVGVSEPPQNAGRLLTAELGRLAKSKHISEAVVAIPYYLTDDCDVVFFPMSQVIHNEAITLNRKMRERYVDMLRVAESRQEIENIKAQYDRFFESPGLQPSFSAAYQMRMMEKYILPPQFDFVKNPNIDPFVAYIFQFKADLSRDQLSDIWQNIYPTEKSGIAIAQHSNSNVINRADLCDVEFITHFLDSSNMPYIKSQQKSIFKDVNKFLDEKVRWLVFKAKYRAESYYNNVREDSVTNIEENVMEFNRTRKFRSKYESFFNNKNKKEKEQFSRYSYNWPYDYFTMVELVKLESKVDFISPAPGPVNPDFNITTTTFQVGAINEVLQDADSSDISDDVISTAAINVLDNIVTRQVVKEDTDPLTGNSFVINVDKGMQLKPGTESIFINGILQSAGNANDYTITGNTVNFSYQVQPSDKILISYIKE